MTNLIHLTNPLVISSISWRKSRRWGKHPLWYKMFAKKHPILWSIGWGNDRTFDEFIMAEVIIYGSDGSVLRRITCRSNDRAKELCDELNKSLDNFLKDVRMELK